MSLSLRDVTKQWRLLAMAASIGTSTAGAAIYPPPGGSARGLIALGAFFATAVSGLVYVLMVKCPLRRHTLAWSAAAAAAVVASYVAVQSYDGLWAGYVGNYEGENIVAGDELTRDGAAWVAKSGHTNADDLLFDAAGRPDRIWTAAGIQRVRTRIRATYYVCLSLFAICVLTTVQAVFCATRTSAKYKVQSTK